MLVVCGKKDGGRNERARQSVAHSLTLSAEKMLSVCLW